MCPLTKNCCKYILMFIAFSLFAERGGTKEGGGETKTCDEGTATENNSSSQTIHGEKPHPRQEAAPAIPTPLSEKTEGEEDR